MRLVYVEWVDSHSGRGWTDMDRIRRANVPLSCRSVGWVAEESDRVIILVPHMNADEAEAEVVLQGCGEMTIPKEAVKRIIELEPPCVT